MRFLLYNLTGEGVNPFVAGDLPLSGVTYTNTLCGPDTFSAMLEPDFSELGSLIREGETAIAVEDGGQIVSATIVQSVSENDKAMSISGIGFTAYLEGQPYRDVRSFIGAECGALLVHIWQHVQSYPDANLGLTMNSTKSGVKLGKKAVADASGTDDGPYVLSWYESHDLAAKFTEIADAGSIDYKTLFAFGPNGRLLPSIVTDTRLGRRRTDVRLVPGENVTVVPEVAHDGSQRFTDVILIGAGEGAAALRATSTHTAGQLARVKTVVDQSITNKTVLQTKLAQLMASRGRQRSVASFQTLGNEQGIQLGDSVWLQGASTGYTADDSMWVRVTAITHTPESGEFEFSVIADI